MRRTKKNVTNRANVSIKFSNNPIAFQLLQRWCDSKEYRKSTQSKSLDFWFAAFNNFKRNDVRMGMERIPRPDLLDLDDDSSHLTEAKDFDFLQKQDISHQREQNLCSLQHPIAKKTSSN